MCFYATSVRFANLDDSINKTIKLGWRALLLEHVQLIFLDYSFIFPLVLMVFSIKILFEPMIQQSLEALDSVVDTEVNFNEVLEEIDLE